MNDRAQVLRRSNPRAQQEVVQGLDLGRGLVHLPRLGSSKAGSPGLGWIDGVHSVPTPG